MLLLANSIITAKDNHDPGTMPGVVVFILVSEFYCDYVHKNAEVIFHWRKLCGICINPDFRNNGNQGIPLALSFDTDSYFYGMLPVMLCIGQSFGLEALPIAITMLILRLSATFICPMTAALLLATGMADVPIKNHIKASALYVWSFSFLCLLFAIFIELIPF